MSGFATPSKKIESSGVLELPVPSVFDWTECLAYLGRSNLEILHRIEDARLYQAVELNGCPLLLEIGCGPGKSDSEDGGKSGEAHGSICPDENSGDRRPPPSMLHIRFPQEHPTPEIRQAAADYVSEWFGLNEDLEPFYAMAKNDLLLGPVVSAHRGLRLIGIPDLFEALVWAVIGQQINLSFAYTMKKRLVEAYGETLPDKTDVGRTYHLFPRPNVIAALTPDDLRPMQFSVRKAEYIIGIARLIEEGRLSKSGLLRMEEHEARETLLSIRGVGAWTADYVGMKCLRRPSAFPTADAGLHQALKNGLGLDRKPLPVEIADAAANWHGFEAYATFYLWQSLL